MAKRQDEFVEYVFSSYFFESKELTWKVKSYVTEVKSSSLRQYTSRRIRSEQLHNARNVVLFSK